MRKNNMSLAVLDQSEKMDALETKSDVSIIGLGFVGLTTAAAFAKLGMKVIGLDVDSDKVSKISKRVAPFHEPQLEELLLDSEKNFSVSSKIELAGRSRIIFLTVGTPSRSDGSMETRFLIDAARNVGSAIKSSTDYPLVVVKSTVVPGTLLKVVIPEIEDASGMTYGTDFGACSNPEFLREGSAVYDTLNPDRLIIGGTKKDSAILLSFYKRLFGKKMPKTILTSPSNAELVKYSNNAFLAMKISFINQIARICESLPNADVQIVAEGIGLDKRIGRSFLSAGLGFGGSCFPKDVKALQHFSKSLGYDAPIVEATMKVNHDQPLRAVQIAEEKLNGLEGKKVAILGLAFKPDTDDMREAVSVKIIEELLQKGAIVSAHDPKALKTASLVLDDKVQLVSDKKDCLRGSDCALLVTEWDEYKTMKPEFFRDLMRSPVLIDGRRLYDPTQFAKVLDYSAIGLDRGASKTTC